MTYPTSFRAFCSGMSSPLLARQACVLGALVEEREEKGGNGTGRDVQSGPCGNFEDRGGWVGQSMNFTSHLTLLVIIFVHGCTAILVSLPHRDDASSSRKRVQSATITVGGQANSNANANACSLIAHQQTAHQHHIDPASRAFPLHSACIIDTLVEIPCKTLKLTVALCSSRLLVQRRPRTTSSPDLGTTKTL